MKGITRIKILAVVFVLLSIGAYFSLQQKFTRDTIAKDDTQFAISDTASIEKIVIEKDGQSQVLTFSGNGIWKINNKYPVRANVMDLLLKGLSLLEVKRTVSEEQKGKVLNLLTTKGSKVTVYYGDQVKTIRFASNENDVNSTFLLGENSQTPYVGFVPGMPGDINNIFKLKENEWRSRDLFTSNPHAIQRLVVKYPSDPQESFEIQFKGGDFFVKDVAKLDTAKLQGYLSMYQYVPLAGFIASSDDSTWSVENNVPMAVIDLTDIDERKSNSISIYELTKDKKNYLAKLGKGEEKVLLYREVGDRLLVKKSYFQKK